jgi:hypothetical protein
VAVFVALLSFWPPVVGLAPAWAGVASCLAIFFTSLLAWRLHAGRAEGGQGAVSVDARGVFVGDALAMARDDVAYGFVEARAGHASVKLSDASHGLRLEVRVRDVVEGREVLRALGLDVSQRVAPFRDRARGDALALVGPEPRRARLRIQVVAPR